MGMNSRLKPLLRTPPAGCYPTSFPGGNSEWEPPDPFSNSEVKTLSADGSVGSPHVRVGHCQDLIKRSRFREEAAFVMHGEACLWRFNTEAATNRHHQC